MIKDKDIIRVHLRGDKQGLVLTFPLENTTPLEKGVLTMKGKIYETNYGYSVRFDGVHKRFKRSNLLGAERFLNALRHRYDEGTFDERDYKASRPLGFTNLANEWLDIRRGKVRCPSNLTNHMGKAMDFFGNKNVKDIQFSELESLYFSLPESLSEKTKANIFTTLHAFFVWIVKREKRDKRHIEMPEFPTIPFELRRRKTISREQQLIILDWLKDNAPFKVWLGIKWLMTYISIRPGELINIKEGDIDRELGVLYVRDNKGKKIKAVPLIESDRESILYKALPHVNFFRHEKRKGVGLHQRDHFGKRCLYTWWQRACENVEIKGVDLYGGTRHSTTLWLRIQGRSPEEIKRATMHTTTKSFNRYFEMDLEDLRSVYGTGKGMVKEFDQSKNGNLLEFKVKNGRHDGI
jgi:integrase